MKKLLPLLLTLGFALVSHGQTFPTVSREVVDKDPSTNAITEDLTIGSGRTLTVASGGTLTIASGSSIEGNVQFESMSLAEFEDVTLQALEGGWQAIGANNDSSRLGINALYFYDDSTGREAELTVNGGFGGEGGASFTWPATTGQLVTTGDVNPAITARQIAPWVDSDGNTANRVGLRMPGTRGAVNGFNGALTFAVKLPVLPPTTLAAEAVITTISTGVAAFGSQVNCVQFARGQGDSLDVYFRGAAPADYRRWRWSGWSAATYAARKDVLFILEIAGGVTTKPIFLQDGVDVSTNFVESTNGTPPVNFHAGLVTTSEFFGHLWPAGSIPLGGWILGTLSTAEKADFFATGRLPSWVLAGGSAVALNTSNFSAGGVDFSSGNSPTGIQVENTSGDMLLWASGTRTVNAGEAFWVNFDLVLTSGTAPSVRIATGGGPTYSTSITASVGTNRMLFICSSGGTAASPLFLTNFGVLTNYTISNLAWGYAGALAWPAVEPDHVIRDATRKAPANDAYLVGIRPQTTEGDGWIRARRTSDGYLMADIQLVGDGRGIVEIRASGNGTFSLGDSAGSPATVLSGATATSAVQVYTPAKAITTGGKIYLDLGTATDVTVWIKTGPITLLSWNLTNLERFAFAA